MTSPSEAEIQAAIRAGIALFDRFEHDCDSTEGHVEKAIRAAISALNTSGREAGLREAFSDCYLGADAPDGGWSQDCVDAVAAVRERIAARITTPTEAEGATVAPCGLKRATPCYSQPCCLASPTTETGEGEAAATVNFNGVDVNRYDLADALTDVVLNRAREIAEARPEDDDIGTLANSVESLHATVKVLRRNKRAMLAAAPASPVPEKDEWRDIATAPKDGTKIDAWYRAPSSEVGFRLTNLQWRDGYWRQQHHSDAFNDDSFVGWMPLPVPPKNKEG